MLIIRLLGVVALILSFAIGDPAPASAETCRSSVRIDENGKVTLKVKCSGDSSASKLSSGKRVCMFGQWEVPCMRGGSRWYSPMSCYISLVVPQPDFSYPAWEGRTTGALYDCRIPGQRGTPLYVWLGTAEPPPDPEQLARQAVRQMQLRPISIGTVPDDDPDSVGLVGMPVWLWAQDPNARTMGPITESASEGGYTVRATAEVERVRWSMGDGGVRACTGPGTPYELRFGIAESPTCGYRFDAQGTYTVTAESEWIVTWSGIGETGTFEISLSDQIQIVVGELNVLTVGGGS